MRLETVAESFATYRAAVLPPNASAVQVLECQRAFTAGAYFLLMGALMNIGDASTPEEDGIAQLEAIRAECEAFGAAGGAPLPPGVTVRTATDAEQQDAILRVAQQQVLDGAGHDCEEWRHGLRCGACGRVLEALEDQNARELERLAMMRRAAAAAGVALTPADIHHEAPAALVSAIRPKLEELGHYVGDELPPGWAFALFLFTIGEGGHVFYIANAERADILVALRDFMRRQTS